MARYAHQGLSIQPLGSVFAMVPYFGLLSSVLVDVLLPHKGGAFPRKEE
jgi:hypothetical protein